MEFICEKCENVFRKWTGQCGNCKSWNSIVEMEAIHLKTPSLDKKGQTGIKKLNIVDICEISKTRNQRISSKIEELDGVLGGGFVPGATVLIGGEPGIGKSTILLQLAKSMSKTERNVVYVSGEESIGQIQSRASRIGINSKGKVKLISSGCILSVIKTINSHKVDFLFVDSIQTSFIKTVETSIGSLNQIKSVTTELVSFCKERDIVLIIVGHVTKEGTMAGPKLLEHMVDVVMYFEGDNKDQLRILRSTKNRFGSVNEIGVFSMTEEGLTEITNPSLFFFSQEQSSGDIIFVAREGKRCIAVAVESLVIKSYIPSPRRSVSGWDNNRLAMMLAIAQSHCTEMFLQDKDVYLNMAGGFKTTEPANDLAVICSIIIAKQQIKLSDNIVALGEVSLKGEIRQVSFLESRFKEAKKLGYQYFIMPECDLVKKIKSSIPKDIKIYQAKRITLIPNILKNLTSD